MIIETKQDAIILDNLEWNSSFFKFKSDYKLPRTMR